MLERAQALLKEYFGYAAFKPDRRVTCQACCRRRYAGDHADRRRKIGLLPGAGPDLGG